MNNQVNFINNIKQRIGEKPISNAITIKHYEIIIKELWNCLINNISGDIVELGCNIGTTSLIIQAGLNEYKSNKLFHVYDSFEGLPPPDTKDSNSIYVEGQLKTTKENFIHTFNSTNINLPLIHTGWFKDIPENQYPTKIAFAFLDGDFYTSILDSLSRIYSKMSVGGIILIHDYGWPPLPGVKLACEDFLKNKPEHIITEHIIYYIGKIIKQ